MISLLIPTMNRSEFVVRLLNYYDSLKFKYYIFIGDSSNTEEFDRTNKVVKALKGRLSVEHYYYPSLNNYAVAEQLIQKVKTPYASFLPDDDFYIPDSIEKCMEFLNHHSDYSCAYGRAIAFVLQNKGAYGRLKELGRTNLATEYSIEQDTAKERLLLHADNYTAVFAGVCRTDMFKIALRNALKLNKLAESKDIKWQTVGAFTELLTSFSLVVQGKVRTIDGLFWIRQLHPQRYVFPDIFDWLTSPNWYLCYEIFSQQIAEDIVDRDGMSFEKAREVVKQAFWMYLSIGIARGYQQRYEAQGNSRNFKALLKQIPLVKKIVSYLRRRIESIRDTFYPLNRLTLGALMNPNSAYHKDFMPIYQVVTNQQNILKE